MRRLLCSHQWQPHDTRRENRLAEPGHPGTAREHGNKQCCDTRSWGVAGELGSVRVTETCERECLINREVLCTGVLCTTPTKSSSPVSRRPGAWRGGPASSWSPAPILSPPSKCSGPARRGVPAPRQMEGTTAQPAGPCVPCAALAWLGAHGGLGGGFPGGRYLESACPGRHL